MDSSIVTVVVHIKVQPGLDVRAREALTNAVAPTRQEAGCLNYDLHQSASDPTEFLFYENWENEEALKAHAGSTAQHRLTLRQQLSELVDGAPRLTIWRKVS